MQRMPCPDRMQLTAYKLRVIIRLYPQHRKQICTLVRLIHTGDAPRKSLVSLLNILVGRENLSAIATRVKHRFIAEKIKTRTLASNRCHCHACFSYEAKIMCSTCGHVTFCYGCYDYGQCIKCTGPNADSNATNP
jgi:hypothetical protein